MSGEQQDKATGRLRTLWVGDTLDATTHKALRAVLDERDTLAAQVAELEAEREADARIVADATSTIGRIWAGEEPFEAIANMHTDLRIRFDERIAALAADAAADGRSGMETAEEDVRVSPEGPNPSTSPEAPQKTTTDRRRP